MPDQSSAASEHALLQEITAPLETLPDDPLALVEADFPTSMRGYDRHAVDDYVEQMTRLVAELHATRSPEAAVRRALERVGDQVSGVLQRAHETAERITAQSRMEAEDRLERARREGLTLIEAAERRVRELDADADRVWAERARILADAEVLSGQLLAVARDAAARFPEEETRPPAVVVDHIAEREAPHEPEDDAAAPGQAPDEPEPGDWGTDEPAGDAAADEPAGDAAAFEPVADAAADEPAGDAAAEPPVTDDGPPAGPGGDAYEVEDPTVPIEPTERITRFQDDSTRIIPPSSDAARRRES
jgi:DivIVA domain-containing protein